MSDVQRDAEPSHVSERHDLIAVCEQPADARVLLVLVEQRDAVWVPKLAPGGEVEPKLLESGVAVCG